MDDVTVDKNGLLNKLRTNRGTHRKIFEEAVAGYHKQALKLLEQHIEMIKAGKVMRVAIQLPEPSDHTMDYDRAIAMLEMSVESQVTVSESDFAAYVMDDWAWKRQFLTTNSSYSATAAAAL